MDRDERGSKRISDGGLSFYFVIMPRLDIVGIKMIFWARYEIFEKKCACFSDQGT